MNMKLLLRNEFLALILITTIPVMITTQSSTPTPLNQGDLMQIRNSTRFTLEFYRKYFDANTNQVISPLSIRILLAMIYSDTLLNSRDELEKYCHFESHDALSDDSRRERFLQNLQDNQYIRISNRIFLSDHEVLNKKFLNTIDFYNRIENDTIVEQIDFFTPELALARINAWVEKSTNGLVKNILTKDAITTDTIMLLLNSIYFKAKWKYNFDASQVTEQLFYGVDGETYQIPTMTHQHNFYFTQIDSIDSNVLEIPYTDDSQFKFWIILPNQNSTIFDVKEKLGAEHFTEIQTQLRESELKISIPIFEIESNVDGKSVLRQMGVKSIFNRYELNLLENGEKLRADDIKQNVKIIVNTEGTEAAVTSHLKVVTRRGRLPFIVNRPFIYAILNVNTNEPIFIGHFAKPEILQ